VGVRRIMVLPFREAASVQADTYVVRESFLAELAKLQRFEVIPLPSGTAADDKVYRALTRGRISAESLVALAKRYRLDGVLVGTITSYRPYLPPHLGLRTKLFSVHSGSFIWAAEGLYDANDLRTMEDLEHYQKSFLAEESSMHGVRINLLSPRKFASYVCHRLVGTWRQARL
jgi:TolB-like protein